MASVHLTSSSLLSPIVVEEAPTSGCRINDAAICIIKCLGVLFTAAGTVCMTASLLIPAISLFVAGVASLMFGFIYSTKQVSVPAIAFGKQAWLDHIGDPGEIPPLPRDIHEILSSQCPFWRERTIAETHMLILIPKTVIRFVDDVYKTVPLTLRTLGILGLHQINEKILNEKGEEGIEKSHWILMTKEPLDGSRGIKYAEQVQLVEAAGYDIPSCLDAAVCILLEHLRSGNYFFGKNPETFIRCKDLIEDHHIVVGGFSSAGLNIHDGFFDFEEGVAGVRRL
jgi:hypothetical protein